MRVLSEFAGEVVLDPADTPVAEAVAHATALQIHGVVLDPATGFRPAALAEVLGSRQFEFITIRNAHAFDLAPLREAGQLRRLSVVDMGSGQHLDLTGLEALQQLCVNGRSARITWPCRLSQLRTLTLAVLSHEFGNLTTIPPIHALEKLALIESSIETLSGIEQFRSLRRIDLGYCRRLGSVAQLRELRAAVVELEIEACNQVGDWDPIGDLAELERLWLVRCRSVPTVRFLDRLRKLQWFVFRGSRIADGDLGPIHTHTQLQRVIGTDKPHYRPSLKSIRQRLEASNEA